VRWGDGLLVIGLGTGMVMTQTRLDRSQAALSAKDPSLYLWTGRNVKRMVPGFEGLFADIYWLRTVQYFGAQRAFGGGQRFELLYPLIEITVTLDPRLEIAYRYGATFLSEPRPQGAGEPQKGIVILERGVAALPGNWRLRQDLGFFTFLFMHDSQRAARILDEAANLPGAAFWLRTLAADLLLQGGERRASRAMWTQMFQQGEEGVIKENARQRLQELDALDRADALTALVAEIEQRTGRGPASLGEIEAAGLARGPVVDSSGAPFEYDRATGKVRLSRKSILWRPNTGE
jgi:hypothetical protein